MIKTYIKSNFLNEGKIYPRTAKISEIMQEHSFSLVGGAMTTINGTIVTSENADSEIGQFAINDTVTIMSIIKGDGN